MNVRAAAIASLLAVSAVAPSAQKLELGFALIRSDGILVPFAVFDGATWIDAWPEPADDRRIDRSIEALPSYWRDRARQAPQVWHATAFPSHKPAPITALTPVVFDEHCGSQSGLLMNLPRRDADSHQKKLAMTSPLPVEWPIDVLRAAPNRTPWQPLLDAARRDIGQPNAALKKAYGFLDGDLRVLYYETLKASGWIVAAGNAAPRVFESRKGIGTHEARNVPSIEQLGIIRPAGAPIWVVQQHAYESEAVLLLSIDAAGVHRVFSKFIGGC